MSKNPLNAALAVILLVLIACAANPFSFQAEETSGHVQSDVVILSAASFNFNNIAPGSIVAAFGQKLANTTAIATDTDPDRPGIQLPTLLGGIRVKVEGKNTELFFVSPNQINFLVPEDLPLFNTPGNAQIPVTVEIIPSDGPILTTQMAVSQVSPAIYTADPSGEGLPAATVLRVKSDGAQVNEPIYRRDENNNLIPIPIDLGPPGERVFLSLFLTGIRRATGPIIPPGFSTNVRVIANGYSLRPAFAGAQGDFAGLDQINVELPRALLGISRLKIAVTALGEGQSNQAEVALAIPKAVFGNWSASGLANKRINSLGASGETVVAGAPSEIFRSTDRGTTWTPDRFGFPFSAPSAIAFAAAGDEVFFAGTERSGVYASAERTWLDTAGLSGNLLLGKRVFSLAIKRQFVFAGSDGFGVFRREIAPRQCCSLWTPFNAGLTNLTITALAVKGDRIFAGTSGGSVFISTDNGASWIASSQGLPAAAEVRAMAASDDAIFASLSNGIYRSTDDGVNWMRLSAGLPASVNAGSLLAYGPNVFAGTAAGVYASTDGGANWQAINQGLTNQETLSLVVNGGKLYAGTPSGVFATTIVPSSNPIPEVLSKSVKTDEDTPLMIRLETGAIFGNPPQYEITVQPQNGYLITSGANATYIPNENFNGRDEFTFRAFNNQIGSRPAKITIDVAPVNDPPRMEVIGGRVVVAGQFVPLYVSVDDPEIEQKLTVTANNLPAGARFLPDLRQLVWVPEAAGSYTFSFTATDDGNPPLSDTQTVTVRVADNPEKAAWSPLNPPNDLPVLSVFADGNDVYALTFIQPDNPQFRLFRSVDQGANWTAADAGLTGLVQSIARSGAALFAITNDHVYRSANNGANWATASGDLPRRDDGAVEATALMADAGKVFVATTRGIFVTTDQGAHWTNITGDLPYSPAAGGPPPFNHPRISSLAVAGDALFASIPYNRFFFAATPGAEATALTELTAEMALEQPRYGVFRTTNNGMNWVAVNNGLRDSRNPQFGVIVWRVVESGTRLYAQTSAGLYFSNNQGANWTPISDSLRDSLTDIVLSGFANLFAIDRDNLYLAAPNYGLFLSRNNGAEWLPISIGLTEGRLNSVAISNSKLFASAGNGKLFVRPAM